MKFSKNNLKINTNFIFISIAVVLILSAGVYEAFLKYKMPEKEPFNPIEPLKISTLPNLQNPDYLNKLLAKDWYWVETVEGSSVGIKPYNLASFKLTFNKNLTFSSTTDCNNIAGEYEVFENKIKLKNFIATQRVCMKSRELDYSSGLGNVSEISFNEKNEMILKYQDSTSFMRFK